MILSDAEIKEELAAGRIAITPPPGDEQFSPTALDLRVGGGFHVWNPDVFNQLKGVEPLVINTSEYSYAELARRFLVSAPCESNGTYILKPDSSSPVLCLTHEWIELPRPSKIAARVEGRSSLARLGLSVHITAPTIHCDFRGNVTLEISNTGPLHLRLIPQKTRICQLIFERVGKEPMEGLKSDFQNQTSVRGRR